MDHRCEHTGIGHRGLICVEAPSVFLLLFNHRTHIQVVSHLNAFVSFHPVAPIRLTRAGTGARPYTTTVPHAPHGSGGHAGYLFALIVILEMSSAQVRCKVKAPVPWAGTFI